MELDDLKKSWQKTSETIDLGNADIRKIIRNRSEQPLAKLKRRFRKGMLLMPAVAGIMTVEFYQKKSFAVHFAYVYLLCFCAIMMLYFYVNYRLVSNMYSIEGDVRSNLVMQTKTLTRFLRLRLLLMRGALALFFILLEVLMYFGHGHDYESWQAHGLLIRASAYVLLFTVFFFFSRVAINHRYRKNIRHLEFLIKELEEV